MVLRWNTILISVLLVCQLVLAAPNSRPKRDDANTAAENGDLNPITYEDGAIDGLDREKRKLPEATFQAKNAILGFVFGNINRAIDAKTRFIDQLDKGNIQRNKDANIEVPKPIPSIGNLFTAIITPKISGITQTIGSLSGTFLGGSSGGGAGVTLNVNSGDASASVGGSSGGGGPSAGIGGILTSFLRLSGPILSSSSGGGGARTNVSAESSEEDDE